MSTLAEIREAVLRSMELPHAASDEMLDALLAALPVDGVIVTPDSLARALHMNGVGCVGRDAAPRHLTRASVVLATIAGDAS